MSELAALVREGKSTWEDLDLDDVDMRTKWNGMFHRRKRTPGKFMMRLRIPNGVVTSEQLRWLASHVAAAGEDGCADITTRANLQLRGLTIEQCDDVFTGLYDRGLTSVQAGMDNVRNMTGNPLAGIDPHEVVDTLPLCRALDDMVTANRRGNPALANLPRKFNIAVNATRDDFVHTHINDLAFDAVRAPDGSVRFNVLVGGYLSIKRCAESFPLGCSLSEEELVPFSEALLTVFRENGKRTDRQKARFIWLVEEWGVDKTREAIAAQMGVAGFAPPVDHAPEDAWERRDIMGIHAQKQEGLFWAGAVVPVGRLQVGDMEEYARIADEYGSGEVRLTVDEHVIIPNVPEARLEALKAEPIFQRHPLNPGPLMGGLVSCTGAQFCGFALTETKMPAIEYAQRLEAELDIPKPVRMHWTGCPNSCGQAQVGDIGLIGAPAKKEVDGKKVAVAGVNIIGGGLIGEGAKLAATEFEKSVPLEDAYDVLKKILIEQHGATPKAGGGRGRAVVAAAVAAPAPPPGPQAIVDAAAGAPLIDRMVAAGAGKAALPASQIAILGVLAGAYIGFGALLAMTVGGSAPALAASNPGLQKVVMGLFGLPFGLMMVLTTGSELFTGNTALVTMAAMRGRATLGQLAKSWSVSFAANFAGSLALVALVVAAGSHAAVAAPVGIAVAKTSYASALAPFCRGVLCNILVCMGITQALSTTSFVGKFFGVLFPITAFVALGFEHSVANMFMVPLGMALGAPVTWPAFLLNNLLPVTLGNIVGGALFVGGALAAAYPQRS